MSPALAQREIALAAVALLGAVLALMIAPRGSNAERSIPQPILVSGGWYSALAGQTPVSYGHATKCHVLLKPDTRGVIDPVIPCNAKLYVRYGDSPEILTQVIDRRPVVPGRRFDLTPALANDLGVRGIQRIRWVFAR